MTSDTDTGADNAAPQGYLFDASAFFDLLIDPNALADWLGALPEATIVATDSYTFSTLQTTALECGRTDELATLIAGFDTHILALTLPVALLLGTLRHTHITLPVNCAISLATAQHHNLVLLTSEPDQYPPGSVLDVKTLSAVKR